MASPMNSQNDRVYAPPATKKRVISADRLLRTRSTFSKSLMGLGRRIETGLYQPHFFR